MAIIDNMDLLSASYEDLTEYWDEVGEEYQKNYNIATIGEAKWITAGKVEMTFKDMKLSHINNTINRFKDYELIVAAFKLELLRRRIEEGLKKLGV